MLYFCSYRRIVLDWTQWQNHRDVIPLGVNWWAVDMVLLAGWSTDWSYWQFWLCLGWQSRPLGWWCLSGHEICSLWTAWILNRLTTASKTGIGIRHYHSLSMGPKCKIRGIKRGMRNNRWLVDNWWEDLVPNIWDQSEYSSYCRSWVHEDTHN